MWCGVGLEMAAMPAAAPPTPPRHRSPRRSNDGATRFGYSLQEVSRYARWCREPTPWHHCGWRHFLLRTPSSCHPTTIQSPPGRNAVTHVAMYVDQRRKQYASSNAAAAGSKKTVGPPCGPVDALPLTGLTKLPCQESCGGIATVVKAGHSTITLSASGWGRVWVEVLSAPAGK